MELVGDVDEDLGAGVDHELAGDVDELGAGVDALRVDDDDDLGAGVDELVGVAGVGRRGGEVVTSARGKEQGENCALHRESRSSMSSASS